MSAFEFYKNIKKNNKKKNTQLIASTPLPEISLFDNDIGYDRLAASNVFLGSPIRKDGNATKKKKKILKEKHLANSVVNGFNVSITPSEDNKSKTKDLQCFDKIKIKRKLSTANISNDADIPEKCRALPSAGATIATNNYHANQDSDDLFNKDVFLTKKVKPSAHKNKCKPPVQELESAAEKIKNTKRESEWNDECIPAKQSRRNEHDDTKNLLKINKTKDTDPGSLEKGKDMLSWIISPVTIEDFFDQYWEKKPLHISRNNVEYFNGICSLKDLDYALKNCSVNLLKNVSVTAYKDGMRTTDDTPGRARPNHIWDLYEKGHSIRVLNPQTFVPNVGIVVARLQEYFRCMVGVNSYLTPAGTQGFAPHYDDIEAFVIQLEGQKHWKVYPPRSESETLPRFSSPDFDQDEIGDPILEVTLIAGDLLYFPRGWIHQARSVDEHHSLHITVSAYQCNTWGDFLKTALPMALENALANDVELRQGLPLGFIDELGVGNATYDDVNGARQRILQRASELCSKVITYCPWDEAADQIGKEFIHSSFPPPHEDLNKKEWKAIQNAPGKISARLICSNVCRICYEDDKIVCYYSTDNSIEPKGDELLGFEVSPEEANVIQTLRSKYPKFSKCQKFITDDFTEDNLAELLYSLAMRALINVIFCKQRKILKSDEFLKSKKSFAQ